MAKNIDVAIPVTDGRILLETDKVMFLCACGLQRYINIYPQNTTSCRCGRSYFIDVQAFEFLNSDKVREDNNNGD